MKTELIFPLLAAFQLKHVLADFFLQSEYMLKKGAQKNWISPLLSHALIHMLGTILICSFVNPMMMLLGLADLAAHFTIDRIKAVHSRDQSPATNPKLFWRAFGVDQMAHHLTHYSIIYILVTN